MKRIAMFAALVAAFACNAAAQMGPRNPRPDPLVLAAMEFVKDKCTRESPCKYKIEQRPPFTVVIVEYQGGRTELSFDHKKNLVKRVDSE